MNTGVCTMSIDDPLNRWLEENTTIFEIVDLSKRKRTVIRTFGTIEAARAFIQNEDNYIIRYVWGKEAADYNND